MSVILMNCYLFRDAYLLSVWTSTIYFDLDFAISNFKSAGEQSISIFLFHCFEADNLIIKSFIFANYL